MLKRFLALLIVPFLLVACGSADEVTDVPFATSTARTAGTIPAPDNIGGVDIPQDFTGGDPIVLSVSSTFSFTIEGEFTDEKDSGTIVYTYLQDTGRLPARNQLHIATSDATVSQQITFEFSPGIEIGQYTLIAPEDLVLSGVSASYSRLVFDGATSTVQPFIDNIGGTLTLTSVGEVLSGQFQFSADFTETSPEGEVDVQSITVTGSFEDVPYQISLDDPFEIEIPLPTRNFTTDGTDQP